METFEFLVTSIARVVLKEHVKIQAENVEDAITRIEDNDYYEEDGDVLSREYELIDYESTEDIMDWEDTAEFKLNSEKSLWTQFYQEFMETLDIPEHISNREGSTTITIRICRREILQLLQDVITNNNLFHLKRKWNKLMIKEPSASES